MLFWIRYKVMGRGFWSGVLRGHGLSVAAAGILYGAVAHAVPDGGVTNRPQDAGAPPDAAASPQEQPLTAADETAVRAALGADDEVSDPVADEAERSGPLEGAALPDVPAVATEIAALTDRQCFRALARARVPYERVPLGVPGIATPVRVTGAIGGVTYRASGSPIVDETMDCRLAVALLRFSRQLRALGVREVHHLSLHRPPDARDLARNPVQTRHPGGLAIDAAVFVLDNGESYEVVRDFHGRRGRPPCGPTARVPAVPAARFLRTIVCDAARHGTFHVLLTPDFNREHRDHFHLEITRGVSWQFVR